MASITLGIILADDQGGMPLIISRVNDKPMLLGAIRNAIREAETRGRAAAKDPLASRGHGARATVLREILGSLQSTPVPAPIM